MGRNRVRPALDYPHQLALSSYMDKELLSPRLDLALRFAAKAHDNTYRKGEGKIPYIMHPFAVMYLLSSATNDEDILIAGLLHDILEDIDPKIANATDIEESFGSRVLEIVRDVSKNPDLSDWHENSQDYIDHLTKRASDAAILVSLADKTHNLISTLKDYNRLGETVWLRFSTKNKADQVWWYATLEELFLERLEDSALLGQYSQLVSRLKQL